MVFARWWYGKLCLHSGGAEWHYIGMDKDAVDVENPVVARANNKDANLERMHCSFLV